MVKTPKLIRSVTIKTMMDSGSDTSYLGEYSNHYDSKWAIDREHTVDCACQSFSAAHDTVDKLEHVISYLNVQRIAEGNNPDSIFWEGLDAAQDVLIEAQDEVTDCNCSGGSRSRNEHQWFNAPVDNYKGSSDAEMRAYIAQDYERMESLQGQDWWFVGIRAEADIVVNGVSQTITSGGLWGIESDSDSEYFANIEKEELTQLREELHTLGFSKRAIATACKNVTRKDG